MDGTERPEPEMLEETCPECGRQLQRRVGRYGPFVGCSGYPDCRFIKRDPPKSTGVTCPQCGQGELVEKRTRFGIFYGCERYPDCDMAVNHPPVKDHPCPECGSVLVARPKSLRCWNCGAELDTDFNVTKSGDPEAEAAARAAKAAARASRASARAAKKPAKKTTAKRKPKTAAKSTKKASAAKKTPSRAGSAETERAPSAAEG
jgi:DNA topoisomerase-1